MMDDPTQQATIAIASKQVPGTAPSLDEGRFVPGTLVAGRYRVISLLGRGGMGEVYRATDLTLAQPVALKFLSDAGAASQRMLEMFHNEVRVARQVSHPNVCRVYDVGEAEGLPYISMEYVDGEDLASLLQRIGRLPAAKAVEIARKVCAGVAAAHDKGVIHRDLKPANIMLDRRGRPVVMDFGLAVVAEQLHGPEARSGTPAYMAPEQLRGEEATAKSDIYSLGLLLYELFTGRRAYEAASLPELIQKQEDGRITSMSSIAAEIDPAVEKAIARCLEAVPARRPATALSVAATLPGGDFLNDALAAGETPSPDLVAASGKTEGLPLKQSVPLTLGLAVLIAAVPFARTNVELHSLVPMEFSEEALAAKVREHAAALGYTARPADRKFDLHWNYEAIVELRKLAKNNRKEINLYYQAESPMQLGYRESPLPLMAYPDGEVTEEQPAPIVSGMLEAWVNSRGQLRRLRAVPPQRERVVAAVPVDVTLLAREVGFDLEHWPEIAPLYTPLYASDWVKTWKGRHPGVPIDVTVQASAWHGRLTELEVIWPWSKAGRVPGERSRSRVDQVIYVLGKLTPFLVFLFSAFLAVRNIRAFRGDLRGARRLAITFLILYGATWIFLAHWTADLGMADVMINNAEGWVTSAALVWLLYIALEPAVRARWPHALVTWSRVLIGRWQDARVGAHVLFGAAMGITITAIFIGMQWYTFATNRGTPFVDADVGTSGRVWVAGILGKVTNTVEIGLIIVFAIFCFRVVLRKDWLAAIAAAVFFSLTQGAIFLEGWLALLVFLPVFFLLVFVVLRVGVLATMVALFFAEHLLKTPGAQDLSHPYEWAVILGPALAISIVLWAFWQTSGEQLLASKQES